MKSQKDVEQELCELWGIPRLTVLADCYQQINGKKAFRNVKTSRGKRCLLPNGRPLTLYDGKNQDKYVAGEEYKLNLFLARDEIRIERENPFLLLIDTINHPPRKNTLIPQKRIAQIQRSYLDTRGEAKQSLIGSMKRLSAETNKKPETFLYELIQNADDYPDEEKGGVQMGFRLTDNYLVLLHDGQPFGPANVSAICTVDGGDKSEDLDKTGFKGIGFKSIFKDSNYVWIHSGGFSFRFDQGHFHQMGTDYPWQVIPIWTDIEQDIDGEIVNPDVLNAPVSICIRPKEGQPKLHTYEEIFTSVFKDERVLLFLRNVKSIAFKGYNGTGFRIKKSDDKWCFGSSGAIQPPEELVASINRAIEKSMDDRIPEKYKDIQSTLISYAVAVEEGKLTQTERATLYAYLPTSVDFGLPFLINGDFIPDGSRDNLFWDLEWNRFLFQSAGKYLLKWLADLYTERRETAIYGTLLPGISRLIAKQTEPEKKTYLELFQAGLEEGIASFAFLPDNQQKLRAFGELIFDSTGLFYLIPAHFLAEINKPGELIHHDLITHEGIKELFESKEANLIDLQDLKKLFGNAAFQAWLSDPLHNVILLSFLSTKSWLRSFDDYAIFLNQHGQLCNRTGLYLSFGEDEALLSWSQSDFLHSDLQASLSEKELFLKKYEPQIFIREEVLEKPDQQKIADKAHNIAFWSYLKKYQAGLSENDIKILVSKPVFSMDEAPYLLNTSLWFNYEPNSASIFQEDLFPAHLFRVIDPEYNREDAEAWKAFWQKMGVKDYSYENGAIFKLLFIDYASHIEARLKQAEVQESSKIPGFSSLWVELSRFLPHFKREEWKAMLASVRKLPVLTTQGNWVPIGDCYLSQEYTGNDTLEKLAIENEDLNCIFLSADYLKDNRLSLSKWAALFQKCGIKKDEADFVSYLVKKIGEIDPKDLISKTQFLFKNKSYIDDWETKLKDLKLLNAHGDPQSPSDLLIGEPYTDNLLFDSVLPSIELSQAISPDYLIGYEGKKAAWEGFFEALSAKSVREQEGLLKLKMEVLLASLEDFKEVEKSVQLVNELYELHSEGLLEDYYEGLHELPLLTKKEGEFRTAKYLQQGSVYEPELDLEGMLTSLETYEFAFIHDIYANRISDLDQFFSIFLNKIGVSRWWKINVVPDVGRPALNKSFEDYFKFLDMSNAYPPLYQRYPAQHGLLSFRYLYFSRALHEYNSSLSFWKSFNEQFYLLFEKVKYWVYGNKNMTYEVISPFLYFIKNNPVIPATDGQCHLPEDLYSIKLKPILKTSALYSVVDLSQIFFEQEDRISLEAWLGINQTLSLKHCLDRISELQDYAKLKKEGIWKRLEEILPLGALGDAELEALESFGKTGKLPNQLGDWKPLEELYYIWDEFDLGLGNSPWLIKDDLTFIAKELDLNALEESDFEPQFRNERIDTEFTNWLKKRLPYLAFAEQHDAWEERYDHYLDILNEHIFKRVDRISFVYPQIEPPIANSEKLFFEKEKTIYHVGSWSNLRGKDLMTFIHKLLDIRNTDFFQNILLWDDDELFEYFQEKNMNLPAALKPKETPPPGENGHVSIPAVVGSRIQNDSRIEEPVPTYPTSEETEDGENATPSKNPDYPDSFTEEEIKKLEDLFGNNAPANSREDLNLAAIVSCLVFLESQGYGIEEAEENLKESREYAQLYPVFLPGEDPERDSPITVMCRSAKAELLYLRSSSWERLKDPLIHLYLKTGDGRLDYHYCQTREEVIQDEKAAYRVLRVEMEGGVESIDDLLKGQYDKEKVWLLLRTKNSQKNKAIFEKNIRPKEAGDTSSNAHVGGENEI